MQNFVTLFLWHTLHARPIWKIVGYIKSIPLYFHSSSLRLDPEISGKSVIRQQNRPKKTEEKKKTKATVTWGWLFYKKSMKIFKANITLLKMDVGKKEILSCLWLFSCFSQVNLKAGNWNGIWQCLYVCTLLQPLGKPWALLFCSTQAITPGCQAFGSICHILWRCPSVRFLISSILMIFMS